VFAPSIDSKSSFDAGCLSGAHEIALLTMHLG